MKPRVTLTRPQWQKVIDHQQAASVPGLVEKILRTCRTGPAAIRGPAVATVPVSVEFEPDEMPLIGVLVFATMTNHPFGNEGKAPAQLDYAALEERLIRGQQTGKALCQKNVMCNQPTLRRAGTRRRSHRPRSVRVGSVVSKMPDMKEIASR